MKIDLASVMGLVAGPACIIAGQLIEGGHLGTLIQGSAALDRHRRQRRRLHAFLLAGIS